MSLWEFTSVVAPQMKDSGGSDKDISDERLRELGIEGF